MLACIQFFDIFLKKVIVYTTASQNSGHIIFYVRKLNFMFVSTQILKIFSKNRRACMGGPENSGPILPKYNTDQAISTIDLR